MTDLSRVLNGNAVHYPRMRRLRWWHYIPARLRLMIGATR